MDLDDLENDYLLALILQAEENNLQNDDLYDDNQFKKEYKVVKKFLNSSYDLKNGIFYDQNSRDNSDNTYDSNSNYDSDDDDDDDDSDYDSDYDSDNEYEDLTPVIIVLSENDRKNIKKISYALLNKKKPNSDKDDCAICLDKLTDKKTKYALTNCNHAFHYDCLMNYLTNYNYKCPMCRESCGNPVQKNQ